MAMVAVACSSGKDDTVSGTVDGVDEVPIEDTGGDGSTTDDDCDAVAWYADGDGDGYVVLADSVTACDAPDGYADGVLGEDCDDTNPDIHPDQPEVCNDRDDDCDDSVDEGVLQTFWADVDDDGFGGDDTIEACVAPDGYLESGGDDCDDTNGAVHPDAEEVCHNGIDDNCDGVAPGCELTGTLDGSRAAFSLHGETGMDYDGQFAAAGDFDGDGAADVVSSAPYSDANGFNSGFMHVQYGPLSGALDGADADFSYTGLADRQYVGWDLHSGDLDGDGIDDLVHGATGAGDYGRVYVQYGSPSGLSDLTTPGATFDGTDYDHMLGRGIALGDLDGDGVDALLFAASGAQTVYVYEGVVSGAVGLSAATATLYSAEAEELFGRGIDARGDLNGDGMADVATTASWADSSRGLVFVSYGPLSGAVDTSDGGGRIEGSSDPSVDLASAQACSTAGDVDGDGYDDLLLGAYGDGDGGSARLFLGPISGTLQHDDHHAKLDAPASGSYTGYSTELVGDVDGDGHADLLIAGREFSTSAGLALVYGPVSGTTDLYDVAGARLEVETTEPYRGVAHYAGDLNGDGRAELMWADTSADSNAGALYMHWGGGF